MLKETVGDGSELRPMGRWHFLWRTVMGVRHAGVRWDIDVDFFDWEEKVRLYRDGRQERVQHDTSSFVLGDGTRIEVAWSTYGLRRASLVMTDGTRRQLSPVRGTAPNGGARSWTGTVLC